MLLRLYTRRDLAAVPSYPDEQKRGHSRRRAQHQRGSSQSRGEMKHAAYGTTRIAPFMSSWWLLQR
jgi:hypothetical protein